MQTFLPSRFIVMANHYAFEHTVSFTPDVLRSFPDLVVSGGINGVKFKTNSALFAIFCPLFKSLLRCNPGLLDHDDLTVIIDGLGAKDIRFLDKVIHEGNIKVEAEDYEEMKDAYQTLTFIFKSFSTGESIIAGMEFKALQNQVLTSSNDDFNESFSCDEDSWKESVNVDGHGADERSPKKEMDNMIGQLSEQDLPTADSVHDKSESKIHQSRNTDERKQKRKTLYKGRGRPRKSDNTLPHWQKSNPRERSPKKVVADSEEKSMCINDKGQYKLREKRRIRSLSMGEHSHDDENNESDMEMTGENRTKHESIKCKTSYKPQVKRMKRNVSAENAFDAQETSDKTTAILECKKIVEDKLLVHETDDKTITTVEIEDLATGKVEKHTKVFLKSEAETDEQNYYVCQLCSNSYKEWNSYVHHQIRHKYCHMLDCGYCPRYFHRRSKDDLFTHGLSHFPSEVKLQKDKAACCLCGQTDVWT